VRSAAQSCGGGEWHMFISSAHVMAITAAASDGNDEHQ